VFNLPSFLRFLTTNKGPGLLSNDRQGVAWSLDIKIWKSIISHGSFPTLCVELSGQSATITKYFGGMFVLTCSLSPPTFLFGTNIVLHVWGSSVHIWRYLIAEHDGIMKLTFWTSQKRHAGVLDLANRCSEIRATLKHARIMKDIGCLPPIMVLFVPSGSKSQRIDPHLI
jgi:hypothetical protein